MVDADSEIITAMSIDSVAFQGPVLAKLQDPAGLALDLYVPPKPEAPTDYFRSAEFREDPQQGTLTCPAGETTGRREWNAHGTGEGVRPSGGKGHTKESNQAVWLIPEPSRQ